MAAIVNTFETGSAVGNREELSNVVDRITPEDTPLYTMMPKGTCASINPEWEVDELAEAGVNAHAEGDQFEYTPTSPVTRLSNVCQIFRKSFMISKTQDKISNAGSAEQTKYQTLKKGVEIRKDVEFALLANTATARSGTRQFGSLQTWLETNTLRNGSAAADGGYTSPNTAAVTAGTKRAFTKDLMDTMLESCYGAGADVKTLVMSPYAKRVFSSFMSASAGVAPQRTATDGGPATIIGAADMYLSDFGMISVVPNRVLRANPVNATTAEISDDATRNAENARRVLHRTMASNVYFLDTSKIEFKWLRPIQKVTDIAIQSDATPSVMIGEGTLCVKNEAGLGVVSDIFGTTATV